MGGEGFSQALPALARQFKGFDVEIPSGFGGQKERRPPASPPFRLQYPSVSILDSAESVTLRTEENCWRVDVDATHERRSTGGPAAGKLSDSGLQV